MANISEMTTIVMARWVPNNFCIKSMPQPHLR